MDGIFLTGFLGSGKTTAGGYVAAHALSRGMRIAYVINDIGRENIDLARITRQFPQLRAEDLSNACIGCNGAEEFYAIIQRLQEEGTELLLVEPTGILLAGEMEQIIEDIGSACSFRVVTLIKVPRFLAGGAIEASIEATASQLKLASVVGLTWCNYLDRFQGLGDERLMPVHEFIGVYAPGAKTFVLPDSDEKPNTGFLEEVFSGKGLRTEAERDSSYDHSHHDSHDSGIPFYSWSIKLRDGLSAEDLVTALAPEIHKIARAKGDAFNQVFDYNGNWSFHDLDSGGRQEAVIIGRESISQELLDQISIGKGSVATPSVQQIEAAVEELLKETAPLQPLATSVLPIDGQTYMAYSLATRPGVKQDLRLLAIRTAVERLTKACVLARTLENVFPSAKRGAGAFLCFFMNAHEQELSPEFLERAVAVDPIHILIEGLMSLSELGPGTGITGAAVRPSFLKNALAFARNHAPWSVGALREAFLHCERIAIPEQKGSWRELLDS